jgi:hypothetical protein
MDFQSLRQGSAIYILHRDGNTTPQLIVGTVQNKPEPKPMYMAQTPGATPNVYAGTNMMQPVVEVIAKCGNEDIPFSNLNPTDSSATYGNGAYFITTTPDAMLPTVDAMMQESRKILSKQSYHEAVLVEGEKMLETLNPRYREEKEQKQDIANLKSQMGNIESTLGTMTAMIQNLQKSITSSSKSGK